ncbi:MAG: hypothetical protein ACPL28_08820 [bacterium]
MKLFLIDKEMTRYIRDIRSIKGSAQLLDKEIIGVSGAKPLNILYRYGYSLGILTFLENNIQLICDKQNDSG